jgi:integrase
VKHLPTGVSVFYRESKKRWILSYADTTGGHPQKVMPREIRRERDAHTWALTFLATKGVDPTAVLARRRGEGPSIAECAGKWLELRERDPRVAPATLKGNRSHLKLYILPKFGTVSVAALEAPSVRAWLREMTTAEPAPSASRVRNVFYTFRTLVADCIAEGWLRSRDNPLDDKGVRDRVPELTHDAEGVRALPVEWVQRLLDAGDAVVPLDRRVRYALGFTTGCRDGELAGLTWEALELDGDVPLARVRQAVALVGSKEGTAHAKPKGTKTRGSVRTMPLHPAAVSALRVWRDHGWTVWVGRAPQAPDYVFPRPDGAPSRPRSAEHLRADLAALGLPTELAGHPIEFKDTRSSFATWLVDTGAEETPRKLLMGHTVSDVTAKHYTARNLGRLAETVGRITLTWPESGTRPSVMPSGTTEVPMSAELLAPPARLERTTFGLGSGCTSGRLDAEHGAKGTKKAPKRTTGSGFRGAIGFRKGAVSRSDGASVVPPELRELAVGSRALGLISAPFDLLDESDEVT